MKKLFDPVLCATLFTAPFSAMAGNDDVFSFFEEEAQIMRNFMVGIEQRRWL